jgi:hypothetical protein
MFRISLEAVSKKAASFSGDAKPRRETETRSIASLRRQATTISTISVYRRDASRLIDDNNEKQFNCAFSAVKRNSAPF